MTEREATHRETEREKTRREKDTEKLSLSCVLQRTKHTKLLLIVSGKREKRNGCATVDKGDSVFGSSLEDAIATIEPIGRM